MPTKKIYCEYINVNEEIYCTKWAKERFNDGIKYCKKHSNRVAKQINDVFNNVSHDTK